MAAATRINQEVTLISSSNTSLKYPVLGVVEDAEMGVDGTAIWATFRVRENNGQLGAPVVIRNFATAQ